MDKPDGMRYLTFLLFFFASSLSFSQTIQGLVRDKKSAEALTGVIIRNGAGNGCVSDHEGKFALEVSGAGDSLRLEFVGYATLVYVVKEADWTQPLVLEMLEGDVELRVVVVSAGRFEQDISEVTVSMEVVGAELLRDKNVASADEILQQTPGVAIVNKEPQIRSGSGYSFGAGSRVQILVDDIPSLSGDAGRPNWDYLPVENVSQVEVIKGASSVLYGSAALSGVINYRTAYPGDTARTTVNIYHGVYSFPQSDSSVYWKKPLMRTGVNFLHAQKFGQFDLVLGGNFIGDDGHLGPIRDTANGSFVDGYNPFTVDRYEANTRGRLNVNTRYRSKSIPGLSYGLNANWNISNSLATLLWENSDTALYTAFDGSATRTKQLLGTIDPFINYYRLNGNKHSFRGRWQSLDNNNDNNQGNFSDQFFGEYQYQHDWSNQGIKALTTTMGLVGIQTKARGELFTGGNPDGRNTAANYAAYLQADKKFFDRLNVSAGVRYEYFEINKSSSSKPVFRTGLNYEIARATYIRASYGQGYRFPSIAEKFIVTGVGSINIFANPDLIAETSDNAEIGLRQGFRIGEFKGFLDMAAFRQEYDNFIEFTFGQWQYVPPIQELGVDIATYFDILTRSVGFKSVNTGRARITGYEASVMGEGMIGRVKLQALAGYTYTKPVSLTPDQVYARPANSGLGNIGVQDSLTYITTSSDPSNNILKYRMQHLVRADVFAIWKGVLLGVSGRYNSHMQNIDRAFEDLENIPQSVSSFNPGIGKWRREHTTGDYVFDVRVGYSLNAHHRISVIVNNLLNREYSIRPLAIEEPRFTMVQYLLTF